MNTEEIVGWFIEGDVSVREAVAFWVDEPGVGDLRRESIAGAGEGEVLVRTRWTGVSRGTEASVFLGHVPPSERERMRAPFQEGDFPGPVKYGYLNVGVVEQGPDALLGRTVFTLFPHQSAFVVPAEAVVPVPDGAVTAIFPVVAPDGTVAVLGHTGRNFAAGMSGGIAYVYDPDGTFKDRCNPSMVTLERVLPEAEQAREERELAAAGKAIARHLDRADDAILRELCEKHLRFTGPGVALALLDDWDAARSKFVKVFPNEYRRALGELAARTAARADAPAKQKAAA